MAEGVSLDFAISEATFTARLVGVTALLMNNPASMQQSATPKARKAIPSPEDEAAAKTYASSTGVLCVPVVMLFQAMVEAGKLLNDPDNKRRRISYRVAASLFPPPTEAFELRRDGEPIRDYAIDVRRAVVQNQGIQRARPRVDPPWQVEMVMGFDSDLISGEALYAVLATAGKQTGIMDYRPQKRGPYGRFQVESFDVS